MVVVSGARSSWDAVVVGAGHNGLICGAYLARAGMDVLVLEARETVGGCASTVDALGARVNICNCDHVSVRSLPIADELGLTDHGLRYLDLDPTQLSVPWDGSAPWFAFADVERTVDSLARTHPRAAHGYRRYAADALPLARLVAEVAAEPPSPGRLLRRAGRDALRLLRWSRLSAADVYRRYLDDDAVVGPLLAGGPVVWGVAPTLPGTGLGALSAALKHVAGPGRPVGGSGALTDAVAAALVAAGGEVRCGTRVDTILCAGGRTAGVRITTGEELYADRVVVACDPHAAVTRWLDDPPAAATGFVERWRERPVHDGYESKLDLVVDGVPRLRSLDPAYLDAVGVDAPHGPSTIVSPGVAGLDAAHAVATEGRVADRPIMFLNVPSVLDPTMAPAPGRHVVSLEVLYTPYALAGGWPGSDEPRRWIDLLAGQLEPGFVESIVDWRAMTPDVYEADFSMPRGHAASYAGGPVAALVGRGGSELTRYETPVPGLYVTGAATFPGAGIWGASGRNCAAVVLR